VSHRNRNGASVERRFVKAVLLAAAVAAGLPAFLVVVSPFVGSAFAKAAWFGALFLAHGSLVAARTVATPAGVRLRSLATDLAATALGIALARWLAAPGLAGAMLATWGFALVQCLRLLAPASVRHEDALAQDDRFEAACARARDLLESA
jgi:hypothetical protein